jgi:Arc/MetJ family transcription regulator
VVKFFGVFASAAQISNNTTKRIAALNQSDGSHAILYPCVWHPCHTTVYPMKMTMHIDEDVLADVMDLTGAASKTEAVELALRDLARRHRQRRFLREGLGLVTPADWDAAAQPTASDALDRPDIDHDAVRRALADFQRSRSGLEALGFVAEETTPKPADGTK